MHGAENTTHALPVGPHGRTPVNVCSTTVYRDLCIGCGICSAICPTRTLEMGWNETGLLIPRDKGNCNPRCHHCLDVCPFLEHTPQIQKSPEAYFPESADHSPGVGSYVGCYVGHAKLGFREAGASGGMASWFLARLLEQGVVDRVICVRQAGDGERLYEYTVATSADEIRGASKSAYYPVELSGVIGEVLTQDARFAVIGLPCFVKAIRFACKRIPLLKRRIRIVAGLVCGQSKSRHFADYLAYKAGVDRRDVSSVVFRDKRRSAKANLFGMRITTSGGEEHEIPWVGAYSKAWVTGMFSPRACAFCDDAFAELADVSFMDAWLPAQIDDPKGSNLIVCRTAVCNAMIQDAAWLGEIDVRPIDVSRVEESQAPVVEWKRRDLAWRRWIAERKGKPVPPLRVAASRPPLWDEWRLRLRETLRVASLCEWAHGRAAGEAGMRRAERRLERILSFYRFYISSKQWPGRAHRFPRWLIVRIARALGFSSCGA